MLLHHGSEGGQISYDSRIAHVGEILKSLKMHNIKIDGATRLPCVFMRYEQLLYEWQYLSKIEND